jgi:hypothetical protein
LLSLLLASGALEVEQVDDVVEVHAPDLERADLDLKHSLRDPVNG